MNTVVTRGDAELIARAIDGEQRAWNELVDRYTRLVWHVVLGFHQLGPEAQADAHQTTWLRLTEQLERIRDPERLGSWLATTARRECTRLLAIGRRETPVIDIDLGVDDAPLEAHLLADERDADVWRAFRELDEPCQQLLRLLLADPPFSYDEIADVLGMKRGSVGPTRRRCLDQMRTVLGDSAREGRP